MTFVEFLSSKAVTLCVLMLGALLSGSCLLFAGASPAFAAFFECLFFSVVALWLAAGFLWDRHRLRQLELLLTKLPQQYLLGEILPKPVGAVEKKYFEAMQAVSRSAIGAVEAANRDKEDYCNYVESWIHELKTPLAAIRLLTDSILQNEDMDNATAREFVTDIGQEAERLSRITEDLLRLTRLDSGVAEAPRLVEVAPVLERVARMLRPVAEEKGVELLIVSITGAVVLATEGELHQILYNLAENAIKYNRPGGRVRVTAEPGEESTILTVEDNGIGIPAEDLSNVFKRFYRVDKARSRAAGGTGLGLSIVRDTARRHGGDVTAHRREGKGTCFTVRLPIQKEEGQ